LSLLDKESIVATAHQPYFFNPGVSLKFLTLDRLPQDNKKIFFLYIDHTHLEVKIPSRQKDIYTKEFIKSEKVLCDFPAPSSSKFIEFLDSIKKEVKDTSFNSETIIANINVFKEIVANQKGKLLKEVLAESFLQFYGIKRSYQFISEILKSKEYEVFLRHIYEDYSSFRDIFNSALCDYRAEYRFRYKNFPFPKLEEDELPFWIIKKGMRHRCFKKDISEFDLNKITIFPRASTLTIFLRLFSCDAFIHGVGGANYEWVGDRVIENFFKEEPPVYVVVSGTFVINDSSEREYPYFFHDPDQAKKSLDSIF